MLPFGHTSAQLPTGLTHSTRLQENHWYPAQPMLACLSERRMRDPAVRGVSPMEHILDLARHWEEQGNIRFLIQSGCAASFCQVVCLQSKDGVFTGVWFACSLSQSGGTAVPKVPVTAAGSPRACHKRGNPQ